jgi:hypothetical protein
MTTPSDGRAERRKPLLADAQLRSDRIHRHRHDLFDMAAPADPILGLVVKLPNLRSKCRGQTPRLDVAREPRLHQRPHRRGRATARALGSASSRPERDGDGISAVQQQDMRKE